MPYESDLSRNNGQNAGGIFRRLRRKAGGSAGAGHPLSQCGNGLYALSVFGDHVQSQVFADTARGADLDRHAADVGLQRKGASAAAGVLTFSLAQAAEAAVTVPADTVCSVAGQPYLQFATTKAATIPAGEWTVDVPAVSLGKTTAHNVEPGCITVMVNPRRASAG